MAKRLLFLSFFIASVLPGSENRAFDTEFRLKYLSRFAAHTRDPVDLASHRHTLEVEQQAWLGKWTAVLAARAWAEAAFAANTNRYLGGFRGRSAGFFPARSLCPV